MFSNKVFVAWKWYMWLLFSDVWGHFPLAGFLHPQSGIAALRWLIWFNHSLLCRAALPVSYEAMKSRQNLQCVNTIHWYIFYQRWSDLPFQFSLRENRPIKNLVFRTFLHSIQKYCSAGKLFKPYEFSFFKPFLTHFLIQNGKPTKQLN